MKFLNNSKMTKEIVGLFAVVFLAGCQRAIEQDVNGKNHVSAGNPKIERRIGDGDRRFLVLGKEAYLNKLVKGALEPASSLKGMELLNRLATRMDGPPLPRNDTQPVPVLREGSLVFGFPTNIVKEPHLFGGTITTVSDRKNDSLGRLKLSDLTPVHVKLEVVRFGPDSFGLVLSGCTGDCTESSPLVPLIGIPITSVDSAQNLLMLDLAALGEEMNLAQIMDPQGVVTRLKTKSSKTIAFDYSKSTLVFDVEARMIPIHADPTDPAVNETIITTRWYLKQAVAFDPLFEVRGATDGVGFFMTERNQIPRINRLSTSGPVKYYLKSFPPRFRSAFAAGFEEWNEQFVRLVGRKLLSYEFIENSDSRHSLLVAGDVRYNIVEWDLVNLAPYAASGPSVANQITGEIFSANVLVQGPKIIEQYTKWFEASERASELREIGLVAEAEDLLARTSREINREMERLSSTRYELNLGKTIGFRIPSQLPPFQDPIMQREDFDEVPAGVTFDGYMFGYFKDLLAHELGHNVGLRHNFRGNLSAENIPTVGGVSHSVMEYLGRKFRHLNRIGIYDVMAVKYGYLGVPPDKKDLFCTDDDVPDTGTTSRSAECSRDDATADPFGYFERRLKRSVDLLVARGSSKAPSWTVPDMERELSSTLKGLALYAATSESTAEKWTNFFRGGDRPSSPAKVKGYVLEKLIGQLCDPTFASVVGKKKSEGAKLKTIANIDALKSMATNVISPLKTFTAEDLSCYTAEHN